MTDWGDGYNAMLRTRRGSKPVMLTGKGGKLLPKVDLPLPAERRSADLKDGYCVSAHQYGVRRRVAP